MSWKANLLFMLLLLLLLSPFFIIAIHWLGCCRGQRLVDAAVFEAVPFRVAVADGCTHIITLCTRPPFK